jgi:hypothetical protein
VGPGGAKSASGSVVAVAAALLQRPPPRWHRRLRLLGHRRRARQQLEVRYLVYYMYQFTCKLVVYHAPSLKVPYHFANLVRLHLVDLGSVVIRPAKKVRSRGFPSGVLDHTYIHTYRSVDIVCNARFCRYTGADWGSFRQSCKQPGCRKHAFLIRSRLLPAPKARPLNAPRVVTPRYSTIVQSKSVYE